MENCQNQFGSNHTGKLFEPRDLATNNLVTDYARGITNTDFWFGINDIDIDGTFQYATGGNLDFTNWRSGQPDNYDGVEDCVRTEGGTTWNDDNCANDQYPTSICEMI